MADLNIIRESVTNRPQGVASPTNITPEQESALLTADPDIQGQIFAPDTSDLASDPEIIAQIEQGGQGLPQAEDIAPGVEGDILSVMDQLQGSVIDEISATFRPTIIGQALPEQSIAEERAEQFSAQKSLQRGSTVGNFALGTATSLIGDLPAELALAITTGGTANLIRRGATAAQASNRFRKMATTMRVGGAADNAVNYMHKMADATESLSKAFIGGPSGRVADDAVKRFAAESLGAGISEGVASTAIGADSDEVAQRILGGLALGGTMAEGMYRIAGGVSAVKKMLTEKGYSADVVNKVGDELEAKGGINESKNARITSEEAKATVDGKESNVEAITKAADNGQSARLVTEQMGEVDVLPTRADMGTVRNSVRDALKDSGIDMHFVRPAGASKADGITIGNKVFIDEAVNDADFARLTGHELLHTSINKMDAPSQRVVFDQMREIGERNGVDTSTLTNENLIEEFFAMGAGRRGKDIINELTAELKSTPSGRNALKSFYEQVEKFVSNLAEKVKFYVGDKSTKEIDDFAEELVRNTIGDSAGATRAVVRSDDVKASERLDAGEVSQTATPKAQGVLGETYAEPVQKAIQQTEKQRQDAKASIFEEREATNIASKSEIAAAPKPTGKVGRATRREDVSNTSSLDTDYDEMGLKAIKDTEVAGEQSYYDMSRHYLEYESAVRAETGVTDEMIVRMSDPEFKADTLPSGKELQLTDDMRVYLHMNAMDSTSGKAAKSGFGHLSNAESMLKKGIELPGNKLTDDKLDLTTDDIHYFQSDEFIGDLRPYADYSRTMMNEFGEVYNHTSNEMGGVRVTAEDNPNYWPRQSVAEIRAATQKRGATNKRLDNARQLHKREGASLIKYVPVAQTISQVGDHSARSFGLSRFEEIAESIIIGGSKMETGKMNDKGKSITKNTLGIAADIDAKFGRGRHESMKEKLTKQTSYTPADQMDKVTNTVMRQLARGALAFNPGTVLKQWGSLFVAAPQLKGGMGALSSAWKDVGVSKKYNEEMLQHSNYYQYRTNKGAFSPEGTELVKTAVFKGAYKKFKDSKTLKGKMAGVGEFFDAGMKWIRDADEVAMNVLWKAAKDEVGDGDMGAVAAKFYELIGTQPSDIARYKNNFQLSSSPVVRSLTMFTSPAARQYDGFRKAVVKYSQDGNKEELASSVMPLLYASAYVTGAGVGYTALKREGLMSQEEQDKIRKQYGEGQIAFTNMLRTTFGAVPLVGGVAADAISAATTGSAFGVELPVFGVINGGIEALQGVNNLSDRQFVRGIKKAAPGLGIPRNIVELIDTPIKAATSN